MLIVRERHYRAVGVDHRFGDLSVDSPGSRGAANDRAILIHFSIDIDLVDQ